MKFFAIGAYSDYLLKICQQSMLYKDIGGIVFSTPCNAATWVLKNYHKKHWLKFSLFELDSNILNLTLSDGNLYIRTPIVIKIKKINFLDNYGGKM